MLRNQGIQAGGPPNYRGSNLSVVKDDELSRLTGGMLQAQKVTDRITKSVGVNDQSLGFARGTPPPLLESPL